MATRFDYRRQALTYDSTRGASPSVVAPLHSALDLSTLGHGTLLDVGGGTGNYARAMGSRRWTPVVIDRSPDMLARAASKGIPVTLADAARLPVPEGSVGAVMLVSMIHHVPDWQDALDEAKRAVAPGGVVALMVFAKEHLEVHWLLAYFPTALAHFAEAHQALGELRAALPGAVEQQVLYEDQADRSLAALCRQPDLLLIPSVRRQTSFIEWAETHTPLEMQAGLDRLRADLAAGRHPDDEVAGLRSQLGDAVVMAWQRPA